MIKGILEEIIKELTATKNNDHITCGGALAWAKGVEVQRGQATVLNTLTESRQFDKMKISKKVKDDKIRTPVHQTTPQQLCRYCGGDSPVKAVPSIWQDVFRVQQNRTLLEGLPH